MIFDFNIPYKIDFTTQMDQETYELCKNIGGGEGVGFGRRVELAGSHLIHIPESLLNTITNVVKLIFSAIACALTFGQSQLLNNECRLAFGRTVSNLAGIGIHTAGLFAPVNAVKWKLDLLERLTRAIADDVFSRTPDPINDAGNSFIPGMFSV